MPRGPVISTTVCPLILYTEMICLSAAERTTPLPAGQRRWTSAGKAFEPVGRRLVRLPEAQDRGVGERPTDELESDR